MDIESIEINDINSLKRIAERCLTESVVLEGPERIQLIEHTASNIEEYCQKSECIFLKSVNGDTISGYILVKEFWNLSDLFVLPEYQGNGIGRALLESAILNVKLSGQSGRIWVNSSLNAELFYRKAGFQDRTETENEAEYIVPLKLEL